MELSPYLIGIYSASIPFILDGKITVRDLIAHDLCDVFLTLLEDSNVDIVCSTLEFIELVYMEAEEADVCSLLVYLVLERYIIRLWNCGYTHFQADG